MRRLALFSLPLALSGCSILGMPDLEGTWMFMVDRNQQMSGDCVDPDDQSQTTYTGTSDMMVEIFKTASGEYAVNLGVYLVGDWNDEKIFEATYVDRTETTTQGYTAVSRSEIWMMASWADGALGGSLGQDDMDSVTQGGQEQVETCNTEAEFSAVRITSNESKYVED